MTTVILCAYCFPDRVDGDERLDGQRKCEACGLSRSVWSMPIENLKPRQLATVMNLLTQSGLEKGKT